ncbi:sugar ABC transporter permease [Clostridium sp.]|uniref:carbohydrate ABC transporter permease n=1 Tax=Clostridium sp. TaxID=1506 RepID=UPI0032168A9B
MSFQKGTLNNLVSNGFRNYEIVLQDPKFHTALGNTSLYAFVVVPLGLIISMFIAITIFEKIKHKDIFETIFFIPYLTSIIAVGIVFRFLLNGEYGFINHLLSFINIGPVNFLDDPNMSMFTLIIFGIWSGLAFNIIILLSGLRNVDENYYKVADMFGATKVEQFFKITLPQMIPMITFLLMVNFINAFKVYAQVFSIFNGKAGIADSATTAVFYIFNKFYVENRYGQGMAAAVILFILILIFTLIQNYILKRISK